MKALIEGLNIIYDEQEERGFIRLNLVALGLMLAVIVAMIVAIGAIVLVPILLNTIGLGPIAETLLGPLRWPILFGVALVVLAIIYRYGPSRAPARWRWIAGLRPWRPPSGRSAPSRSRSTSRTSAATTDRRLARRRRHPADVVLAIGPHRAAGRRAELGDGAPDRARFDHQPAEAARPARRLRRQPRREVP
jgi:hypothetical protein